MSLRNPRNNPQLTDLHSVKHNNGPFGMFLWSGLVPCLAVSMPESKIVERLLALLDSMHVKAKQLNGVMGLLRYKTELRALEQTYMKLQSQSQLQAQALQQLQLRLSSTEQDKRVAHERLDTMSGHYQSALGGIHHRSHQTWGGRTPGHTPSNHSLGAATAVPPSQRVGIHCCAGTSRRNGTYSGYWGADLR